jgi:hypothetical protein
MTPEKQRIAIAEACGWKGPFQLEWLREYGREGEDVWEMCGTNPEGERAPFSDYLNDLNAMHEAEDTLFGSVYDRYYNEIAKLIDPYDSNTARFADFAVINSTAAQRAEAFLKTIGKWEDSQ